MLWFRLLILVTLCSAGSTMIVAVAQEPAAPLPEIWKTIKQEVVHGAEQFPDRPFEPASWVSETAERIARDHDRQTIDALFKNVADVERLTARDEQKYLKDRMKRLAASVIIEIADRDGRCELKDHIKAGAFDTIAIVAMDCYHDDASRDWLFDLALNGDKADVAFSYVTIPGHSYIAIQLLRGYEPGPRMRTKLEQALQAETPKAKTHRLTRMTRADALRSLLSSWDYATNLQDPAVRARYRTFQSRLWRFYGVGPKMSRSLTAEFQIPAAQLLEDWQAGDERFVLHVFENPDSTHDEMNIALWMSHKLSDSDLLILQAIAESDSPQAPFLRRVFPQAGSKHKQPEK